MSAQWNLAELERQIRDASLRCGVRVEFAPIRHPDYLIISASNFAAVVHREAVGWSWSDTLGGAGDGEASVVAWQITRRVSAESRQIPQTELRKSQSQFRFFACIVCCCITGVAIAVIAVILWYR